MYSSFKKVIEWNNEVRWEMRMEMGREGLCLEELETIARVGVERAVTRAFSQEGTVVMEEETEVESTKAK